MDGVAQRGAASWENGTLAPVDRLRTERADSPTPGLVEGTEPGEAGLRSYRSRSSEPSHLTL